MSCMNTVEMNHAVLISPVCDIKLEEELFVPLIISPSKVNSHSLFSHWLMEYRCVDFKV